MNEHLHDLHHFVYYVGCCREWSVEESGSIQTVLIPILVLISD